MKSSRRQVARALMVAAVSLPPAMALNGCYQHVVGARGPGAESYNVYEPHYKPEEEQQIEDWFGSIFRPQPADKKK